MSVCSPRRLQGLRVKPGTAPSDRTTEALCLLEEASYEFNRGREQRAIPLTEAAVALAPGAPAVWPAACEQMAIYAKRLLVPAWRGMGGYVRPRATSVTFSRTTVWRVRPPSTNWRPITYRAASICLFGGGCSRPRTAESALYPPWRITVKPT